MRYLALTVMLALSVPAQAQYNKTYMRETSRQLQYLEWQLYTQQPYWQGYYPTYYRPVCYPYNYYWGW